jgi:hypothetical protein
MNFSLLKYLRTAGAFIILLEFITGSFLLAGILGVKIRDNLQLSSLIPTGAVEGWVPIGEQEMYTGEDLFLYINGGAEIYHEYGFRGVAVQEFRHESGRSISLEIFEMTDPDAAFGIFSFKTTPEGRELPIGGKARLEYYYLNIRKGRYLVTLTGFDEEETTLSGLQSLGKRISAGIEALDSRPGIVSLLPGDGLLRERIMYFRGPLGLFNDQRFFSGRAVFLREGVRGGYAGGYSLFILKYDTKTEAATHWKALNEGFETDPAYFNFSRNRNSIVHVEQNGGIRLQAVCRDRHIVIIRGSLEAVERVDLRNLVEGLCLQQ